MSELQEHTDSSDNEENKIDLYNSRSSNYLKQIESESGLELLKKERKKRNQHFVIEKHVGVF